MIHRHTALAILVLLIFLSAALLSAGCTRASVNKEPSVPTPEKTTAMQTTENLPTPVNSLEIPKNPEANESMIIAPPENNTCGSPDANQSVCPVPTFTGTQVLLSVTQTTDQATAYCMAMNNSLEIRKDPDGSEYTFCILADGTSCDVWDYYRRVCPLISTQEIGTGYTGVAWAGPDIQDLASGFCTAMNNRLETRQNPDGTISVVCILADGKECDVIAYYEGTCPVVPDSEQTPADETFVNPSEAFCRGNNLTYELRLNDEGIEYGICIFPDGTECDAWEYYVGACSEETALDES